MYCFCVWEFQMMLPSGIAWSHMIYSSRVMLTWGDEMSQAQCIRSINETISQIMANNDRPLSINNDQWCADCIASPREAEAWCMFELYPAADVMSIMSYTPIYIYMNHVPSTYIIDVTMAIMSTHLILFLHCCIRDALLFMAIVAIFPLLMCVQCVHDFREKFYQAYSNL